MNKRIQIQIHRMQPTFVTVVFAAFALHAATAAAESGAERFDQQVRPIVQSYLKVGDTLAADSVEGVRVGAERIAALSMKLDPSVVHGEHASHYAEVSAKLKIAADALAKAKTLEEARAAYKRLSMPMGMWASVSKPEGIDVVYCPMAKASWLQKKGAIRNPYYGSEMLNCGQVVKAE